jgi:hypothetical protein
VIAVIALFALAGAPGIAQVERAAVERGLRFDSPRVLDLASPAQHPVDGRNSVVIVQLPAAEAARILAAPAIAEDPPLLRFSDDVYGCTKPSRPCSEMHEKALIVGAGASVRREGKRLTIAPRQGISATFVDRVEPATRNADGDAETHWYLGRLPGSGYERVEVQFGHDAPGSFLVNPRNGRIAFVHNGADLVAPSPDGRLLLTWNSLNPPLTLRVAALDETGPRPVVSCAATESGVRLTLVFKGWRDASTFDIAVAADQPTTRLAAEMTHRGPRWILRASAMARLESIGFSCTADETSG